MRRIAVIEPRDRKVVYKTVAEKDISRAAGPELTAHTVIDQGYGLFSASNFLISELEQLDNMPISYALNGKLYALNGQLCYGTGILYAFDQEGRTLNIPPEHPRPIWLEPTGQKEE